MQSLGKQRFYGVNAWEFIQGCKGRLRAKMRNKLLRIFHVSIITVLMLSIHGCGYKAPPYYPNEKSE